MWRSLVAYAHGVRVVAGSNPVIPTKEIQRENVGFFVFGKLKQVCSFRANKKNTAIMAVLDFLEQHPNIGSPTSGRYFRSKIGVDRYLDPIFEI